MVTIIGIVCVVLVLCFVLVLRSPLARKTAPRPKSRAGRPEDPRATGLN